MHKFTHKKEGSLEHDKKSLSALPFSVFWYAILIRDLSFIVQISVTVTASVTLNHNMFLCGCGGRFKTNSTTKKTGRIGQLLFPQSKP